MSDSNTTVNNGVNVEALLEARAALTEHRRVPNSSGGRRAPGSTAHTANQP